MAFPNPCDERWRIKEMCVVEGSRRGVSCSPHHHVDLTNPDSKIRFSRGHGNTLTYCFYSTKVKTEGVVLKVKASLLMYVKLGTKLKLAMLCCCCQSAQCVMGLCTTVLLFFNLWVWSSVEIGLWLVSFVVARVSCQPPVKCLVFFLIPFSFSFRIELGISKILPGMWTVTNKKVDLEPQQSRDHFSLG